MCGEPGETAFGVWCIAEEWSEAAIGIAARRLDLDHIRTEIGQELAAGPTDGLGQIQDPIGLKGLRCWGFHEAHYNTGSPHPRQTMVDYIETHSGSPRPLRGMRCVGALWIPPWSVASLGPTWWRHVGRTRAWIAIGRGFPRV